MRSEQNNIRFLGLSKILIIALLASALVWTGRTILNQSNARKMRTLPNQKYLQSAPNLKFDKLPIETLHVIAERSLEMTPVSVDISERANRQLLNLPRPCLDCHQRIVIYDLLRNAKLTKTGMEALRNSYSLSPYGEEHLMKWRLNLSLKFWRSLDTDLKQSALNQISALSQNAKNREWLWKLKTDIPEIRKRLDVLGR